MSSLQTMLTPRFALSQDAAFLTVSIYAPFTNIDQTEIFMDGCDFRFSSPPYFLRLHLPGEVEESDAASGCWDADTTSFVIKCPKVKSGEHFQGLEMLTQLLTPKGDTTVRKGVEELGGENGESEDCDDCDDREEDIEWYFEQTINSCQEPISDLATPRDCTSYGYGFAFTHTEVYTKLLAEFGEILDLAQPDTMNHGEREAARRNKEREEFSSDHYLCDLYEDDSVQECLAWQPELSLQFSPEQQEQLLALPKKKYLIPRSDLPAVHLSLADLLFGHCFAVRSSLGEISTEHGWLAAKLSASLSTCARFSSTATLMTSCVRRSLIYPLHRHWLLAVSVWRDVIQLLQAGAASVIQALLSLTDRLGETAGYYVFTQLYVSDYCSWLQTVPASHLSSLAAALTRGLEGITKESLGLEIEELEEAARLTVLEEETEGLVRGMERVGIRLVAGDEAYDSDDSSVDSDDSSDESDDSSDESDSDK